MLPLTNFQTIPFMQPRDGVMTIHESQIREAEQTLSRKYGKLLCWCLVINFYLKRLAKVTQYVTSPIPAQTTIVVDGS